MRTLIAVWLEGGERQEDRLWELKGKLALQGQERLHSDAFIKIPNTRVQRTSGWWTHWGVARMVCLERVWKPPPPPHTHTRAHTHTHLAICIFSIWLFLYNKPLNVSNMLCWILWAILANYGTWGGGCGNPWFIASRSEAWEPQDLQLASRVGEQSCGTEPLTCGVSDNSG